MRSILALPLVAMLTAAAPPAASQLPRTSSEALAGLPGFQDPATPWRDLADAEARRACREKLEQAGNDKVDHDSGATRPDAGPYVPGDAQLFYAVDRSVEGCRFLVPVSDPGAQVLPPDGEPPRLIPAR